MRSGTAGPELSYEPDPAIWLVGPTDERPRDRWLPGAVEVMCRDLGADDDEARAYVTAVLELFSREDDSPLTDRLLRWRDLHDPPFPVRLGMISREHWSDEELADYVSCAELANVEPAIIEQIDAGPAARIVRGLSYSLDEDVLVVSVRYVIESRSRTAVAVVQTASDQPGQMMEALDDLDDLARLVEVEGEIT